jgi:type IX secretion system PorP/SprF family membrane protein
MKNTVFALTLFFAFGKTALIAQQLPLFTQYTELQTYLNPAAIPVDYLQYNMNQVAGLTYRLQWLGIEDAPRTGLMRYERVREDKNLSSFGGLLFTDKVGANNLIGVYGRYSYQLRPSGDDNLLLGLGLTGGLIQYRLDGEALEFEPGDILKGDAQTSLLPDFGIGANLTYYPETGTKWYAGVSLPQTFGLSAKFETVADELISIKRVAHAYANGGAIFAVGQQGFMEPSVWIKYAKNAPVQVDFNLRQKFVNNFWMGLGYSTSRNLHLEMGMIMSQLLQLEDAVLRIGYGFDYNISPFGNVLGTTHELNVSYAWGK